MELKKKSLVFLLLNVLIRCIASQNVTTFYWVLNETSYTRLCSTKDILTVNGEFPGPAIYRHRGERFNVNVRNEGKYNVTIHWHGVKQPRNPWSDGPNYVTQCPIKPGANFTYEIILSDEEGTLWWHAHSDWSRATVHGPLIILPEQGKGYPFPQPQNEVPIVLASWFKGDVMEIIETALQNGGEPNQSDAFTINGQPGDLYDCSTEGTFKMMVDYGKTYLLRIINAIMNEEMFFMVANHSLTVVGTDGAYIKPINTSYIMITPGQTMDVLITADQSPSYYYMASRAYAVVGAYDNTTTTAIVQYNGNYTPPSTPPLPNLPNYTDTDAAANFTVRLRSLANEDYPVDVPQTVDTHMYITISMNTLPCVNNSCDGPDGSRLASSLNNISFVEPSIDVLQAYYKGINGVYDTDFPNEPPYYFNFTGDDLPDTLLTPERGTKVKVLDYNSNVEIVFQGTNVMNAAENHPMHLHGYSFYVVGNGTGNFDNSTDPTRYNLVDPPEVNTVGVPKNGWVAIRFRADNPGVWFMHCHLERHASWGMDTVLIVKNGTTSSTSMLEPPSYLNPC
ncbi:laccase-14 [Vitis vinifera]|uniref:laccase-14 n=1 Tax=Vitis vinifera TaxID=29760 RepID=UPI00053FA661|nr:laccase-14 [Vitis vinifera]|eukprot:XP_010665057.1 PREDICTED: laccase-14 [Vitis vinifera]